MRAFELMKMALADFSAQPSALRVRTEAGTDIWLAPTKDVAQRLVNSGKPRSQIWTVSEMVQMADAPRVVAGLLALSGVAYGDVFVESD